MIVCLGTTTAIQRAMIFKQFTLGGVNRAAEVIEAAAGKSVNAAKVAATLGANVVATGFVGGDRGRFLRTELDRMKIAHDFVEVRPQTRLCVTILDRGGHTHTELIEESQPVEIEAWDTLKSKLVAILRHAKILTLSGALVPGAQQDFYGQCTRLANEAGAATIVDAQGEPLLQSLASRPLVAKPNRGELAVTLGRPIDGEPALKQAMLQLIDRGARSAVVTLGSDGAMACDGQSFWRIQVPTINAVNSIGSGDAFTGGLAAALADGEELIEAVRQAAACGVVNALTLLAGEVRMEDVRVIAGQVRVEQISR
jgi:1-phosphofructokinase family hexose kinase